MIYICQFVAFLLRKVFVQVLLLASFGVLAQTVTEDQSYYSQKEEGWYFYKDPRNQVKPKAEPPALLSEEDTPFTVKWIQKNIEVLKDRAIEHPDDREAVRAYMYAQKVLIDKAENFANSAYSLGRTDPLLDEENSHPGGTGLNNVLNAEMIETRAEAVRFLAKKGGLFFFYHSECKWCIQQYQIVQQLAGSFRITYYPISVDNKPLPGMNFYLPDKGMAKKLGLTVTPTLVYAVPPNQYHIISQGFGTVDSLSEKMIYAGREAKMFPKDLLARLDFATRNTLTPEDLRDPSITGAGTDPESLNRALRAKATERSRNIGGTQP